MWTNLLILFCLLASGSQAANILVAYPLPLYSHFHGYVPIFKALARRGHNVTVVSPFPLVSPMANYTDVVIPSIEKDIFGNLTTDNIRSGGLLSQILGVRSFCPKFLDPVFRLPELKAFINDDTSHFDLVLLETFFCQEPFIALGQKYNAPVITIHPVYMNLIISDYTGNVLPLDYVSHYKVAATDRMSFTERVLSSFYYVFEYLAFHLYFKSKMEKYMRNNFKYPGAEKLTKLDDLLSNISMVLLDNNLAASIPKPLLPNVVEFGGLYLKSAEPLPQDLETYMKNSEDGVIYFSWGSIYKSTYMKPEVLSKFLSAFSKLKQRVLFKWENGTLEGKPSNVRIAPWFPQASVLGHSKLRVFITHGGLHGVIEAAYNGVPILGTPLFADQYQNVKFAEQAGYAISLNVDSFSEQELLHSLNKLLHNPSYKEAALRQSSIIKDKPLSLLDNTIYWIEYVMRHSGAKHLKPSASGPGWNYLILVFWPVFASAFLTVLIPIICIKVVFTKRKAKKN